MGGWHRLCGEDAMHLQQGIEALPCLQLLQLPTTHDSRHSPHDTQIGASCAWMVVMTVTVMSSAAFTQGRLHDQAIAGLPLQLPAHKAPQHLPGCPHTTPQPHTSGS